MVNVINLKQIRQAHSRVSEIESTMTSWNLGILTVAVCVMTINIGSADKNDRKTRLVHRSSRTPSKYGISTTIQVPDLMYNSYLDSADKTTEKLAGTTEHHEHHPNTVPATIQKSLVMDTSEKDFRRIRNYPAFVDKSLLIKTVLEINCDRKMITAPPGFGKSVNLSMMKRFFEFLPNEKAQRANRELFNGLQIEKEKNIMIEHCGKYPVIFLNFKTEGKLESIDDAIRFLCGVVEEAYKQHRYLAYSDKLTEESRKNVKDWCDGIICKNVIKANSYMHSALKELSYVLVEHYDYKKHIIALVDGYDSVATSAMMGVEDKQDLRDIIDSSIWCFSGLVRKNINVERVIIMGISYVEHSEYWPINTVHTDKFQYRGNRYSEYYGLTKEECQELLIRFNLQSHYDEVVEYYGGYARNMFSISSVMNYLNNEKIASYWTESCFAYDLSAAFRFTSIRSVIIPLLNETNIAHTLDEFWEYTSDDLWEYTSDDIYNLKKLFEPSYSDKVNGCSDNLFLLFLLDRGYFALVQSDEYWETSRKIKIPNQEIRLQFKKLLGLF